jgi:hypothetical protein
MSWKVQSYIWPIVMPASEKWTLLCLGNHCGDDGSNAFPSIETIALETGLSTSTVRRALKSLLDQGIIEVQAKATNRRPVTYAITFRGVTTTPLESLGVSPRQSRGVKVIPLGVSPRHPNHKEPFIETTTAISKKEKSGIPADARALLNPIFRDRSV